MSDYIPPEVLEEILLRLPAKALIIFTSVSKLWYSLISDPKFISMYTNFNSVTNDKKGVQLMLRYYSRTYGKEMFTVHTDHDLSVGNYQLLDCPLRSSWGHLLEIVGSCNGLVCLNDFGIRPRSPNYGRIPPKTKPIVIVWNPSLGKSIDVPSRLSYLRPHELVFGFGFDSISIDYKVVRIISHIRVIRNVSIFALSKRKRSWRSLRKPFPSYTIFKSRQAFFNGNIHWMAYYDPLPRRPNSRKWVVATFDVANEVFGELAMPDALAHMYYPDEFCQLSIVVFGNYLSLIRYNEGPLPSFNRCCIWIMKEYGVAESWIIQYTICPYNSFEKTLHLRSDGKILLVTNSGELVSFDPENKRVNGLKIYGEACSFDVDTYVESLVFSKGFNRFLGQGSSSAATLHDKV